MSSAIPVQRMYLTSSLLRLLPVLPLSIVQLLLTRILSTSALPRLPPFSLFSVPLTASNFSTPGFCIGAVCQSCQSTLSFITAKDLPSGGISEVIKEISDPLQLPYPSHASSQTIQAKVYHSPSYLEETVPVKPTSVFVECH